MNALLYPTSLAELDAWRGRAGTTLDEARKRFMQFVVLEGIAASRWRDLLCFKGGNALRFIYRNPRSTIDLDFTAAGPAFPDDAGRIRDLLTESVSRIANNFGVKARSQRVRRNPPGSDKTTPTYEASVAYQFPGDRHFADFESWLRPLPTVVELEISLNDEVCETGPAQLHPDLDFTIRACTLEDIIAEKLRALLQQRLRNRNRRQDVYDIARAVANPLQAIDRVKVASFFIRKCRARSIEPRRSAFDEDIRRRAEYDYAMLFDALDPDFIPFETAWTATKSLVDSLAILP